MVKMETDAKVVWAIRTKDGLYRGKSDYTLVKSMRSAHTWPGKGWAENRMQPGDTLVPFMLVEVDPDTINNPIPKATVASPDLKRLLEAKL